MAKLSLVNYLRNLVSPYAGFAGFFFHSISTLKGIEWEESGHHTNKCDRHCNFFHFFLPGKTG